MASRTPANHDRDVDNIVSGINNHKPTDDFSDVSRQIQSLQVHDRQHFQQDMAAINSRVDMKALGFPEHTQILGVRDGQIVTRSADGKLIESHDPKALDSYQSTNNTSSDQVIGSHNRHATLNADGSGSYQVQKGDKIWNVAGDLLQDRLGRNPSQNEIGNFMNEIQNANPGAKMNRLHDGTTLQIPPNMNYTDGNTPAYPDATSRRQAAGSMNPTEGGLASKDGGYNPAAPPGFADAAPGQTFDSTTGGAKTRTLTHEGADRSGNITRQYSGSLDDGFLTLGRTQFTGEETTDKNGNLTHRHADYQGSGANIDFVGADGKKHSVSNVSSVDTKLNTGTGRYETTITDVQGNQYAAVEAGNGQVGGFAQRTQRGPITRAEIQKMQDDMATNPYAYGF